MSYKLSVDVGGTFTDIVVYDDAEKKTYTTKVSSTPSDYSIGIEEGIKNGDVEEAWCTGTAAVISPIGEFATEDETYPIGEFKSGPLALRLYHSLTDLQFGRSEDKFGWTVRVAR